MPASIAPHNPVGGKVLRMGIWESRKRTMVLGKRGMLLFGLIIPEGGRRCGVAKYGSKGLAVLTPLMRIIDDATVQAHSEKGVSYQLPIPLQRIDSTYPIICAGLSVC